MGKLRRCVLGRKDMIDVALGKDILRLLPAEVPTI